MLTKASFPSWPGNWFCLWGHWPFWWLVFYIFLWKLSADVALHVISISLLTMYVCVRVCVVHWHPQTPIDSNIKDQIQIQVSSGPRVTHNAVQPIGNFGQRSVSQAWSLPLMLLLPLLLFCIVALCCSQWQSERGTRKMVFSKQIGCQEGGTALRRTESLSQSKQKY